MDCKIGLFGVLRREEAQLPRKRFLEIVQIERWRNPLKGAPMTAARITADA
jgi:hypothetical protein